MTRDQLSERIRLFYSELDDPLVGQPVDVFWHSYRAEQAELLCRCSSTTPTPSPNIAIVQALR